MSQNPASPTPNPDAANLAPDNSPHRPTDDREEVYYEGSPMLRGDLHLLLGWGLLGLVCIATPILVTVYVKKRMPWWADLAFVMLGCFFLVLPLLKVKAVRYRITNYRIDYERGLLSRTVDTLEMWHVEHIKFHQSLWGRILGVGNIEVIAHDPSEPTLYLRSIPRARELFTTLEQRIIAVKRARGVIKMDTGG